MTTYELSISTEYVPDWSIREGVREIIQNAIDSNTDGFNMSFNYDPISHVLKVHNERAFLSPSSLLMGKTDKAGVSNKIGEFGEGYKLGTLALIRAGKRVTIFNRCAENPQRWESSIKFSKKYDSDVLVFTSINIKPKQCDKLTFHVKGITPDEWKECQKMFLNFGDAYGSYDIYDTPYGKVLHGDDIRGHIFVGGIFIDRMKDLHYGYDFGPSAVTLNRDRHTIASWSLGYTTARMWNSLGNNDKEHLDVVEAMLMSNVFDVRELSESHIGNTVLVDKLADRFREKYGGNAHPVSNTEQAKRLSFTNILGITTGEAYTKILERSFGSVQEVISRKQDIPVNEISIYALGLTEQRNLAFALALIRHEDVSTFDIKVVDFNGDDILGRCIQKESVIMIARKVLVNLKETLTVLVHEYAHTNNHGDGEAAFGWMERNLWADIMMRFVDAQSPQG